MTNSLWPKGTSSSQLVLDRAKSARRKEFFSLIWCQAHGTLEITMPASKTLRSTMFFHGLTTLHSVDQPWCGVFIKGVFDALTEKFKASWTTSRESSAMKLRRLRLSRYCWWVYVLLAFKDEMFLRCYYILLLSRQSGFFMAVKVEELSDDDTLPPSTSAITAINKAPEKDMAAAATPKAPTPRVHQQNQKPLMPIQPPRKPQEPSL